MKLKIDEEKRRVILGPERQEIKDNVYNYLFQEIVNFIDNSFPCQDIEEKVPGYEAEWCAEEVVDANFNKVQSGLRLLVDGLTNDFMYNANKIEL